MTDQDTLRCLLADCAATPLFAAPGRALTLADGCASLLVDFSMEDKEAKGLRKAPTGPRPVQHFTALEVVAEARLLLLLGDHGGGKSVFARRLALHLAGEAVRHPLHNLASLRAVVPRGADDAHGIEESWHGAVPIPLLRSATQPGALELPDPGAGTELLLILDDAEALGDAGPAFLAEITTLAAHRPDLRVLLLGETELCGGWAMPAGFRRHRLLELLPAQREAWRARCGGGPASLPCHPGLLSLALALDAPAAESAIVDRWLSEVARLSPTQADAVAAAGFAAFAAGETRLAADLPQALRPMIQREFVLALLAARHLASRPAAEAAQRFRDDPARWSAALMHLAHRQSPAALLAALAALDTTRAALLAADILGGTPDASLAAALLRAITADALPIPLRVRAGRHLARLGDPRDLEELVTIPAGVMTMGAATHPNSSPPHALHVERFRIGRHPVTNALYRRFVEATGRAWISTDGLLPERANAPAVDLTWHDARACCDWLTGEWRRNSRIATDEIVRLPTEPEWEYAARGTQPDGGAALIYPWSGPWSPARCNSEEAGLNDTCAVGLFPAGRSPFGCDDMAGQVWEWCTTLWGEDMATPSFRYPYADDGREDSTAPQNVRRVLRGGCFSSGREKAGCTYRGSLEAAGHWRGNGFRVVVAR